MLMTVLRGELAVKQSRALIRTFKLMKDYILDNRELSGHREYMQLSMQTAENSRDVLKLKADTVFKDEIENISNESSIVTEYIPEDEHSYTVRCKIVENNKIFFEVRTFAGSNDHAKRIADNWKNNAYEIYPKILDLLTGKNVDA